LSKIIVVDANVAIKWILPEIYSWEALGLLQNEENQLLVPDFFFSECGNILWKRVRRGEIDLITSQQYLKKFSPLICRFINPVS
jgi:predicted nucleic acid-binding protein